ncbi:MAG TPA: trypsin-like peptidase domain-containing protein, partial [Dissulfurispiraceae bacterium]|nr:trypsin-like peptidase domain-containing protein [Dissulfurispiraceae bacterium]
MSKKLLWIPALLLVGFLLGGITYYFITKSAVPSYAPFIPSIPKHVQETSKAFSDIVRAASPAVVNISTTKTVTRQHPFDEFFDFFYPFPNGRSKRWKEQSLGSGVIASPDGYIVTNYHVIERADEIKVILLDKRTFKAKVIGSDPKTDVAIIRIDAKGL